MHDRFVFLPTRAFERISFRQPRSRAFHPSQRRLSLTASQSASSLACTPPPALKPVIRPRIANLDPRPLSVVSLLRLSGSSCQGSFQLPTRVAALPRCMMSLSGGRSFAPAYDTAEASIAPFHPDCTARTRSRSKMSDTSPHALSPNDTSRCSPDRKMYAHDQSIRHRSARSSGSEAKVELEVRL